MAKKKKGERQKDNISQLKLSEMTEVNLAVNMFHSSLKKKPEIWILWWC